MNTNIDRMKELIDILNEAARVYYQGKDEIMSNFEYDKLYDELTKLEEETGITLSESPTIRVGYDVVSELPKENHGYDILSLDKTKDVGELASWLSGNEGVLSWKLDGLTVVVTYEDGKLSKAVTRGNGITGEVITGNAKTFKKLPLSIPYKERLVLRGEAIINYSDFEKINEAIEDPADKYKNPRNLCSGSVRQLDSKVTAERNVHLIIYSLIDCEKEFKTRKEQLDWIKELGFETVEHAVINQANVADTVKMFSDKIAENEFPSDGLVLTYNDIEYSLSLGRTAKFPRHSMAFKWEDELAETVLREIEWSASRTGLINPVAIFDPVMLEGTTVSRASVHNISIVKQLELGIGDTIQVYKANMIIPQIAENLTRSSKLDIPCECPVCKSGTVIANDNGTETLVCPNPDCLAKQIKMFTHFVSRDAMNIDGLSEATIERFISEKIITGRIDIYHIDEQKEKIINMDRFGEKSYKRLAESIDKSRTVKLENLIYSLGIPGIGISNARMICKAFDNDIDRLMNATYDELTGISGMGEVITSDWISYMNDENNRAFITELLSEVDIVKEAIDEDNSLMDMTVVITGSLEMFSNRNELKRLIENKGGKVTGSVTGNTTFLINNDVFSSSSKNKKAKELGVTIISEADFVNKYLKEE